ncbi:MAG: peroxiredoxin [Promethearchaeia archaeon]
MSKEERTIGIPLIGDEFPTMKVKTTHGDMFLPDDMTENGNKWFILFSHPGDFTPVCTTEFYAFSTRYEKFQELNCNLIGLSIDQVFAHIKWAEWIEDNLDQKVPFPIIADHGEVGKKLGMIHPGQGASTVRAVFLVDPKGVIRIILYYPKELGRNLDEIERIVKAMQIADEESVAMPADWPNNQLIGDEVILHPASDVKAAEERKGKEGCYDWWFCHKKI